MSQANAGRPETPGSGTADVDTHRAVILEEDDETGSRLLRTLRADPRIEFVDRTDDQRAGVAALTLPVDAGLIEEPTRWAYYPWRRIVVGVLGPRAFRALRLDRNRNLITADEQARLGTLRIGVAGLSVGHVIAHTLAAEGLCGELRLADFDTLELSNLNRVPATLLDLGVNKAVVAARRIAELDPYLPVRVLPAGITPGSVDDFLDGLDIVVEECDSLDMKAMVREAARVRRQPVLMATSDRGLIDVERFDTDPERPILHGLLGTVDSTLLSTMSARDKIPHMLGHLDVPRASSRAAASMVEVGRTLSTWPQLAGDVTLGAVAIAEAVRRIGLDEGLASGRVRIDVTAALDQLEDPSRERDEPTRPAREHIEPEAHPPTSARTGASVDVIDALVAAAVRAPSGGNSQPWQIDTDTDSVTVKIATAYQPAINIGFRGSAVAVGAAVFNIRVAAAAHQVLGRVEYRDDGDGSLSAVMRLGTGNDPELARLYRPMLRRETNRHRGTPGPVSTATAAALDAAAAGEGARLRLLSGRAELDEAASILAATDRLRYLTPRLHWDMVSELRWPGDPSPDTGIDVRSLELDDGDLAVLQILRRRDVMAHLAQWDAGAALGDDTDSHIRGSSALAVVCVPGRTLFDYAQGGSGVEAVWIAAEQHGLAVQPVFPVFLHAHDDDELTAVSESFAGPLSRLRHAFADLIGSGPYDSQILVLRLADAPPASTRSRRRPSAGSRLHGQ